MNAKQVIAARRAAAQQGHYMFVKGGRSKWSAEAARRFVTQAVSDAELSEAYRSLMRQTGDSSGRRYRPGSSPSAPKVNKPKKAVSRKARPTKTVKPRVSRASSVKRRRAANRGNTRGKRAY